MLSFAGVKLQMALNAQDNAKQAPVLPSPVRKNILHMLTWIQIIPAVLETPLCDLIEG